MIRRMQYARLAYDAPFCVYLALLVITREFYKEGSYFFLQWFGYPLSIWVYPIVADVLGRASFQPGIDDHTFHAWLLLALAIFVLFRSVARIGLVGAHLRRASGFILFVGPPLVIQDHNWLLPELALPVLYVWLFAYRGWPKSAAWNPLVLALHLYFWRLAGWPRFVLEPWPRHLWLAAGAALVWGLYVRLEDKLRASGTEAIATGLKIRWRRAGWLIALGACILAALIWGAHAGPALFHTHVLAGSEQCGAFTEQMTGLTILNPFRWRAPEQAADDFLREVSSGVCGSRYLGAWDRETCRSVVSQRPVRPTEWRLVYRVDLDPRWRFDFFYRQVRPKPDHCRPIVVSLDRFSSTWRVAKVTW